MVGERKSPRMREQVLELYRRGVGKRKIALALGISKNTVKGVIRGDESGSSEALVGEGNAAWERQVYWEKVQADLGKKYVTIKSLHAEFAPDGVQYLRFWRALQRRIPLVAQDQVRIRFQYKPGQRLEIDYCDGIPITDRLTGQQTKTQLFAAASAFSDYFFGEFVMTQRREEFIASQDRMHHFFGGVYEYVVIDNLKSGVHHPHIYDPDVNPVYVDYANHMGFAVLPARPSTPRDKPTIETNIGVVQRQFFAEVRNRTFYSLAELNSCFREYLERLNSGVMKDYGVSRAERFAEEKTVLKALPVTPFEVAEYRMAKVHPDCHIQVEKNFYSVPYLLIGQQLRVRLSAKLVEAFNGDHESVAVHSRLRGCGKFSTYDTHYPEQKIAAARFDVQMAKRDALRIGPETAKLVDSLLDGSHPLRYLRRVQGLLRLKHHQSARAIEYGCHQAMLFDRPRLKYITDCVKKFDLAGHRPRVLETPERDLSSVYLKQNKNEEENRLL